jgi:uncharacterized iron-regulated membrane protein
MPDPVAIVASLLLGIPFALASLVAWMKRANRYRAAELFAAGEIWAPVLSAPTVAWAASAAAMPRSTGERR